MIREYPRDVIAGVATPAGRGGIGIVRLSGARLEVFLTEILGRVPEPRQAHYGHFYGEGSEIIDSGIALLFAAPHSFTGENILELQAHGGPAVMQLLLERCLDLGARLAQPGEFTKRAFLNGKLDLAQAESVADLIEATTGTAARAAQRSLRGEFSARVHAVRDALIKLRMFTEATLDFPEEDIEFLREADARGQVTRLQDAVVNILLQAKQGQLLRDGIHVVLIGQPNVGKSSLLNGLAGDEIAIVTPIAGTTRDSIKLAMEIHGVPLHIVDTAGLRDTADTIEQIGMARTWRAIDEGDCAVLIVDDCVGMTASDVAILSRVSPDIPRVVVHNKIDLSGTVPHRSRSDGAEDVFLSAKTGEGIEYLRDALLKAVGAEQEQGEAFIARERHVRALQSAADHLACVAEHLDTQSVATELVAEELRLAHEALCAITGEFTADDLLGEIFERFCIGK